MMHLISVVIIAKNEEGRLADCLQSARWADEIVVVDSGSTDKTAEIAARYGAKVLHRPFDDFASQKNFAVSQAGCPWVFSLDADERIPEALAQELRGIAQREDGKAGYYLHRDNWFFGRCLKHAGQEADHQMRFFRRDKARFRNSVHEVVDIDGPTGELAGRLTHHSCRDLNDYFRKFNHYTQLEAEQMKQRGVAFRASDMLLKPPLRFAYTYVLKGGFLDGYQGFLFHLFSAFYVLVKYAKLREITRGGCS